MSPEVQERLALHVHRREPALARSVESDPPDVVFNLVESFGGHGRLIPAVPALLEALRIPYTGADARALALSSDKRTAKLVLRAAGLPTPDERTLAELRSERGSLPGRWILKSVHEHASIGLDEDSVMPGEDPSRLADELERRLTLLGGEGFAERFIDGRELNLALLDGGARGAPPLSLPPAEIDFEGYAPWKPKVVGWRAKWDESSYEYHHTPRRFDFPAEDDPLLSEVVEFARRACRREEKELVRVVRREHVSTYECLHTSVCCERRRESALCLHQKFCGGGS